MSKFLNSIPSREKLQSILKNLSSSDPISRTKWADRIIGDLETIIDRPSEVSDSLVSAEIDIEKMRISLRIRCILEGYDLGINSISFRLGRPDAFAWYCKIDSRGPDRNSRDYIHPHIQSSNTVCFSPEAAGWANNLINTGDLLSFVQYLCVFMNNISSGHIYQRVLHSMIVSESKQCGNCKEKIFTRARKIGNKVYCNTCAHTCNICYTPYLKEDLVSVINKIPYMPGFEVCKNCIPYHALPKFIRDDINGYNLSIKDLMINKTCVNCDRGIHYEDALVSGDAIVCCEDCKADNPNMKTLSESGAAISGENDEDK